MLGCESFCSGGYMVEPFIAESRVSGSGEKVNGTVYAREVF